MGPLEAVALVLGLAFLPPFLFALQLRSAERFRREPWSRVLAAFGWGAMTAILVAVIAEELALRKLVPGTDPVLRFPWAAWSVPTLTVIVAPVAEELAKALGLVGFRDADPEPENGYVYGGAVGLGFAATENLVYIGSAWLLAGRDVAVATAAFRGVATVSLHAAATAIAGYGIWRARFGRRRGRGLLLLPFSLAAAILVHAAYNALAGFAEWAVLFAFGFGVLCYAYVIGRIRRLDARRPNL